MSKMSEYAQEQSERMEDAYMAQIDPLAVIVSSLIQDTAFLDRFAASGQSVSHHDLNALEEAAKLLGEAVERMKSNERQSLPF